MVCKHRLKLYSQGGHFCIMCAEYNTKCKVIELDTKVTDLGYMIIEAPFSRSTHFSIPTLFSNQDRFAQHLGIMLLPSVATVISSWPCVNMETPLWTGLTDW